MRQGEARELPEREPSLQLGLPSPWLGSQEGSGNREGSRKVPGGFPEGSGKVPGKFRAESPLSIGGSSCIGLVVIQGQS